MNQQTTQQRADEFEQHLANLDKWIAEAEARVFSAPGFLAMQTASKRRNRLNDQRNRCRSNYISFQIESGLV